MKTFELFCENKRSADLFWECAKIFQEARWEPVHFTIGMMEAWSELEENEDKRNLLLEILRICDDEILLEQSPYASRFQRGYARGVQRKPGSPLSYGVGRVAGAAAEKAGQVGGWLSNQWRNMKGSFAQGVGGGPHDPSAYAGDSGGQPAYAGGSGGQQPQSDDTIPFNQQGGGEVPPEDIVSVRQGAQYFDQLLSMMQKTGMDQQYIRTLKGLRDAWVGNSSAGDQPSLVLKDPSFDYQRSKEAGSAAARGKSDVYQRYGSLQSDVKKIQQELEQARAAGDHQQVAKLAGDLQRYKRKTSRYKRKARDSHTTI